MKRDEVLLARLRDYSDRELREAILVLTDWRNHSEGTPVAEMHQRLLLIACDVRDERRQLARAVDSATNPFTVIRELGPDDDDDSGGPIA
jgi:hypothetical protein